MEKLGIIEPEKKLAWFWDKEIKSIPYTHLPAGAVEKFEWYNERWIFPEDYIPGNFSGLYVLEYSSDEKVYIATQKKVLKKMIGEELQDCIYLYEERDGKYLWNGEAFLVDSESYTQVWYIETSQDFQRGWYWFRRILLLNALSQFFHKKPLVSSTLFCSIKTDESLRPAKNIWERLTQNGVAKMGKRGGHDTFSMLKTRKTKDAVNALLEEKFLGKIL